jgi:GntR family transcriptional regulator
VTAREDKTLRGAVAFQRRRRELLRANQRASLVNSSVRQTYDLVRTQLSTLAPGNALVEADLMRSLAASRGAVRGALQRLADEGLVSRKTKVGTRVERFVHLPFSYLLPDEDKPTLDMTVTTTTSVVAAPDFLQEIFGLEPQSSVAVIDGQAFYGSTPIGLSVGYVPLTAAQAAHADRWTSSTVGTIDFIEQHLGIALESSRATLGVLVCDAETARRLVVADGAPMMWLKQIFVDVDGNDRGLLHAWYRADRVGFSGRMQRRCSDPPAAPWSAEVLDPT